MRRTTKTSDREMRIVYRSGCREEKDRKSPFKKQVVCQIDNAKHSPKRVVVIFSLWQAHSSNFLLFSK